MDLSKKRIIMIHGLASKPPAKDLHEMWSECLVENVRLESAPVGRALDANRDVLRHAYWANAIPHHIEDDRSYVTKLRRQVDKVIAERREMKRGFHVGTGAKVKAFFKSRAVDVVDVFTSALTIKDDVAEKFLREVDLYSNDQYISDAIRDPLECELRSAWDEGCDVALLSHSMGTFISYDVLWRFAHRNVPGFRPYRNKRVRLFVTMGSPLGDPIIRDLLFARHHEQKGKRAYPTNIDYWHNYACLGDVVSHDSTFEDDFFAPMRKEKVLEPTPKYRGIDYKNLHNPFESVSHSGNKGRSKRNPHKSYGYLVQPRLGSWIRDFLKGDVK